MPNTAINIPNTGITILNPISRQIANDVINFIGLPVPVTIYMPNEEDSTELKIRPVSNPNADFKRITKASVSVKQNYTEASLMKDPLLHSNSLPVFTDEDLDLNLSIQYNDMDLKFEFRLMVDNKELASVLRNRVRTILTTGRNMLTHTVDYNYLFPNTGLYILDQIFELREKNSGYGDTFSEWYNTNKSDNVVIKSDATGSNSSIFIEESQSRILGSLDLSQLLEKSERNKDEGKYEINFDYEVRVRVPINMMAHYPMMVHGSFIPKTLFLPTTPYSYGLLDESYSRHEFSIDHFTRNRRVPEWDDGVPIPEYFLWDTTYKKPGMQGMLKMPVTVTDDNPTFLVNLAELGNITINEFILDYMRAYPDKLLKYGSSLFNLTLYENERILSNEKLTVDSDLNVFINTEFDPRKRYVLYLSVMTDPSELNMSSAEHLLEFYDMLWYVLRSMHIDSILKADFVPRKSDEGYMYKSDFIKLVNIIGKGLKNDIRLSKNRFNRIMNFILISEGI